MKSNSKHPHSSIKIFTGQTAKDSRGLVSFVNEFDFKNVKRFYQIQNASTEIIRAFHGHLKEAKYIYVASGSILLAAAEIDNPKLPSKKNAVYKIVLGQSSIAYIPPGYANGFKSLQKNSTVIVFSTSTLEDSPTDDYRYPPDYWGDDVWNLTPSP